MKQKDRLKILIPSLRENIRYVKIKVVSGDSLAYGDLEAAIYSTFLQFYGELGVSQLSLWLIKNTFDEKEKTMAVRCNNRSVDKVIAGLGLVRMANGSRIIVRILKVSGTIKGLG